MALQRLGVSGDADAARRLVDPLFRGGEIAQRLADAGPGLRHQHVRRVAAFARFENGGGGARIILLPLSPFGAVAGQAVEPCHDVACVDSHGSGLRARRRFLPFGQAREQPAVGAFGGGEARLEQRRPRPALAPQRLQRVPCAFAFGPAGLARRVQHRGGGARQEDRDLFLGARRFEADRGGDARGRRHGKARREQESEKFEQVEPRQFGIAEPVARQRRAQQQMRRPRDGRHRLAAPDALRAARRVGDPDADMARVNRGQGESGGAHRPTLGTKEERGKRGGDVRPPWDQLSPRRPKVVGRLLRNICAGCISAFSRARSSAL